MQLLYTNRNVRRALARFKTREAKEKQALLSDPEFLRQIHYSLKGKITSDFNPNKVLKSVREKAEVRAEKVVLGWAKAWKDYNIVAYASFAQSQMIEQAQKSQLRAKVEDAIFRGDLLSGKRSPNRKK